jgi:hypothetical protein
MHQLDGVVGTAWLDRVSQVMGWLVWFDRVGQVVGTDHPIG